MRTRLGLKTSRGRKGADWRPALRIAPLRSRLVIMTIGLTALALTACNRQNASSPSTASTASSPTTIHVAAAASLAGVLAQLRPIAAKRIHVRMAVNAAASGTLAQQILLGAPVDVFISANTAWMDELARRGRIDPTTRVNVVRNQLVVIAQKDMANPPHTLDQLAAGSWRVAMGDPDSVPAGQYTRQSLIAAGIWKQIQPRILPAVDVTAALAYVQSGAAPLGFVYSTDAAGLAVSRACRVVLRVPDDLHKPIVYPAAVVRDSHAPDAARRLLTFLLGPTAQRIFKQAGFLPAKKTTRQADRSQG